ncbi:SDR family oxidoreductase [Sphingobacterium sp. SGG-5]|uniref:SDR family oxidoreductase n=1 Tax=Sphingobacterium sp. SGG-5 TaxID=2710881 RepID=UPI0013EBFFA9|nr:SDR family oxidoreductase [Sphingobacterium sp. SGG-5]NGM61742.1 SDR family oxidoreductase [Sphingobacterium sp. SGG-5]
MEQQNEKKVFLTGGTAGIGRATALLLAEKGYQVFIIGRDAEKLKDFLDDAQRRGVKDRIASLLQDLSDHTALERILPELWASHGPFHILINNAGLAFDGVCGSDPDNLTYMLHTNLEAYLLLSGFFADQMIKASIEGDIINIGSMSAETREGKSSGYVASKSGIQGFTEAFRKEVNPHNIRVSLIEPGAVGTDMQDPSPEEQRELEEKREMLKAEDIAHAIHFTLEQDRRIAIVEMRIKPLRQFI